jgi:two-component system chemotaxis sensor kinase CheA
MSEIAEATKEFLIESHENLEQLDIDLVALEQTSDKKPVLARIFRTLHTIKGSCSFLGFQNLEAVAHAGENLLGKLRDGEIVITQAITSVLLAMTDAIRQQLATIESAGHDGEEDHAELIEALNLELRIADCGLRISGGVQAAASSACHRKDESERAPNPQSAIRNPQSKSLAPSTAFEVEEEVADGAAPSVYDASVRIDVGLLDKLMNIAGEIVLSRNQILQYGSLYSNAGFQSACRQLNLITTELQEHVMKTRLQPIANVWCRFPRVVRDAATVLGKQVRLESEGGETELDKTLIEAVRDPLTHLVRNAVDHGIEPPEVRLAAGKPAEGRIRLRAYHEGGQVNIEIADDGGGIDLDHIKARAQEQHLVTPEQVSKMSAQTILNLIFLPGFSTARAVTTVSGRGVGMDVVKSNIEKIGGSVDLQSTPGQGTTVRIRIPLTLAIIKVLIITCANARYAIPQVSIVELIRLEGERMRKGIHALPGDPSGARGTRAAIDSGQDEILVYRYRGRLLPLVSLRQVFGMASSANDEPVNLVVLQAGDREFGLIVDAVNDTQEIVVKPLWRQLKGLACFAGATIMGDGQVALILDVFGLALRAGVVPRVQDWSAVEAGETKQEVAEDRETLLVVRGTGAPMAIPLERVARLEEFRAAQIEQVGGQRVVQYRGQILPLIDVDHVLHPGLNGTREVDPLDVVVCSGNGKTVGLVVHRIEDIVEQALEVKGTGRPGVLYTAVVQNRVTEILDVDQVIRAGVSDARGTRAETMPVQERQRGN